MRLHQNDTQAFIASLAASIQKDPASLENWRCLHVQLQPDLQHQNRDEAIEALRDTCKHLDGDIVFCPDHDVLLISREKEIRALYDVAEEIALRLAGDKHKLDVGYYELFYDWRAIRSLLLEKAGKTPLPATNTTLPEPVLTASAQYFREVESLKEVFHQAVHQRAESGRPLTVMLVEDDPVTRRMVSNILKENYSLITAKDALEAVANYLMYAPDIVFLDINLPDVSGFSVLHQIMNFDKQAYVVMFSGHGYIDNINMALGSGASGFVAKPFRREKLMHYIEDCALHHKRVG